jgi:uncharacterized protein YjbI with pentapeptide repeats
MTICTYAWGRVRERPDVVEQDLEAWAPRPLEPRFELEDAHVRGADWSDVIATGGSIKRCRLDAVRMGGARLRSLRLVDVIVCDGDLSNADWTGAELVRVHFERCRMIGLVAAELTAEGVTFEGCGLDLANLRGATLRRATFEDCGLDDVDLSAASIRDTRFADCRMRRVVVDGLRLLRVDLRGSTLEPDGDMSALRGAVIDSLQLVELGPLLARGLGIDVRDG